MSHTPVDAEHMIVLTTNASDPSLELRKLRRFADGSGFTCELHVCSHGFCAQRPFYFSERSFAVALRSLRHMQRELAGEARFEEEYEHDQFLRFTMRPHGHILVSGQLFLFSPDGPNRLSFAFQTDQTCLAPFNDALEPFDKT